MLGNIGITEIGIILVIGLLFFGPKKLPQLAKSMGQAITEFKQTISSSHLDRQVTREKTLESGAERKSEI